MSEEVSIAVESVPEQVVEQVAETVVSEAEVKADVNFKDLLAEELRGEKAFANFKDINELAKSYLNANSLIGKRIQDMSPEDLAYVNSLKGIPQSSAEYEVPLEAAGELGEWYKEIALKAGLDKNQAKVIIDEYIMKDRAAKENAVQLHNEKIRLGNEELQKEFGTALNERVELAKRAVEAFGGDDLKKILNESGLGSNPTIVKMFAKIGKELMEDKYVEADHEAKFGLSPNEARAKVDMLYRDPAFMEAYFNPFHPKHKDAVMQMKNLDSKL